MFNVKQDPSEARDLASAQPAKLKQMLARYEQLRKTEVSVEQARLCPVAAPNGCVADLTKPGHGRRAARMREERALTRWRTEFTLPVYDVATMSVLLDATGLTSGHFRLKGHDLGKFWTIKGPSGKMTQRFYHLPSALLKPGCSAGPNAHVLADEMGPSDVASVRVVFSETK